MEGHSLHFFISGGIFGDFQCVPPQNDRFWCLCSPLHPPERPFLMFVVFRRVPLVRVAREMFEKLTLMHSQMC